MSALYIGRFQPFHLGHLDAVKQIFKKETHLIIGIGSAEQSYQPGDPFTAGERFQMIKETLLDAGFTTDQFDIIPVRNIDNYALWVNHVETYCPPFKTVYTGSEIVKNLFEEHGAHPVSVLTKNLPISATKVRKNIKEGKSDWEKDVSNPVKKHIKTLKTADRLTENS